MPTIIHGGSRVPKDVRGLEEHGDGEVGGEGKAVVGPDHHQGERLPTLPGGGGGGGAEEERQEGSSSSTVPGWQEEPKEGGGGQLEG